MSRERMTDEALRAMLEAATPGPWHMEHASKAPPGEEWGEVVARLHPAGGAGAPVPGMRLTWSRRSVGVLAERNARLISAAPDLAREVLELRAELAQARAELAAAQERLTWPKSMMDGAITSATWLVYDPDDGYSEHDEKDARSAFAGLVDSLTTEAEDDGWHLDAEQASLWLAVRVDRLVLRESPAEDGDYLEPETEPLDVVAVLRALADQIADRREAERDERLTAGDP